MISHNWSPMKRLIWLRGSGITGGAGTYETITGNPVSFTAKAAPLRQLSVAFSPVQEGTGDPSPDNVRPISGWDSLNVEQRGKNLLNLARTSVITSPHSARDFAENQVWVGLSFNNYFNTNRINDYEITNTGVSVSCNSSAYGVTFPVACKPNTQYALSFVGGAEGARIACGFYKKDGTFIRDTGGTLTTFTTPNECEWVTLCVAPIATDVLVSYSNIQLELGSTATSYQPYNPSSRSSSISLGSTVYSGYVDVVTGVGEVTMASVDLGTLTWTAPEDSAYFLSRNLSPDSATWWGVGQLPNVLCGIFKPERWNQINSVTGSDMAVSAYSNQARVSCSSYSDAASFKAAMNGVKLVYELATPIPIQLTPQEVNSLAGDNNLWSDANQPITVEYRKN